MNQNSLLKEEDYQLRFVEGFGYTHKDQCIVSVKRRYPRKFDNNVEPEFVVNTQRLIGPKGRGIAKMNSGRLENKDNVRPGRVKQDDNICDQNRKINVKGLKYQLKPGVESVMPSRRRENKKTKM